MTTLLFLTVVGVFAWGLVMGILIQRSFGRAQKEASKPVPSTTAVSISVKRMAVAGPRCPACDKPYADGELVLAAGDDPLSHLSCVRVKEDS